ncbi:ankyrin repeat domain containing protein [Botrytis cinerea]
MSTQAAAVSRQRAEAAEYSFAEALSLSSKDSFQLLSKGELGLPPSPNSPSTNHNTYSIFPERTLAERTLPEKTVPRNLAPPPQQKQIMAPPTPNSGKFSKAQAQCMQLCLKTTALSDRISVRVLEYLTTVKELPQGFEALAHDFLDTCHILFSIEAGLEECNHHVQNFPIEMITELDHKFRATQANFQVFYQLLAKFLHHENVGSFKRGWGKIFSNTPNDIRKMAGTLSKTRDDLRMSALVFQWSLGNDKIEKELGIGYLGLAAALNRMDEKAGRKPSKTSESSSSTPIMPSPLGLGNSDASTTTGWPGRTSSSQHPESFADRTSARDASLLLGSNLQQYNTNSVHTPMSPQTVASHDSGERSYTDLINSFDNHHLNHHIDDARSHTETIESGSLIKDVDGMMINPSQAIRLKADPDNMPRWSPRGSAGSNTGPMKAALISAIPNTGSEVNALKEAILAHDAETVRLLLTFGANPNEHDRDGITPLRASVDKSFLAGATTLLKYGADPNLVAGIDMESPLAVSVTRNMVGFSHLFLIYNGDANHATSNGNTLLISSINKKTSKKFMELLLKYGANPNAKSKEGKTALFEAITCGRADIVSILLENGADPNLPGPKHMLWPATYQTACLQYLLTHGADPKKCPGIMELATSINNIESVRTLLTHGVDPNAKKRWRLLLSNKADPNTMASEYPAWKCVTHNRIHFLPALVSAGADIHNPKGIAEMAVSCNNMEALNWLLDQGVNPNDKSAKGMSPLTTAIREERLEMIDLLLLRGADVNVRGQDWPVCMAVRSPQILKRILSVMPEPRAYKGVLEMAVHANQLESVKLLLAAGVSVEDKNGGVFSPLTTAIREDRKEIVSYLLNEAGADINAPGEHLPIVKALRRYQGGDTDMIELLLDHGADPNKIYRGWNAIMQAIENGDAEILKLVAGKAGVNLEAKDEMGRTVSDIAASRGWNEAVTILHDNMSL